jgi:LmbE family N-acetylglucosaminyl deacetylase
VDAAALLGRARAGERVRVAIVAAHPDDETIGAGAFAARACDVHVVHLSDGAPGDRALWPAGLAPNVSRATYASIRRQEVLAALAVANVSPTHVHALGFQDQELARGLAEVTRALLSSLTELEAELVITHPYEGGHPDHDAAAFATRAAILLRPGPALAEMTAYHAGPGGVETGRFLPADTAILDVPLAPEERERKRAMLASFGSQREVLAPFGVEREPLRAAPPADFTRPPHAGRLHHERMGWMEGATFRRYAAAARLELGL